MSARHYLGVDVGTGSARAGVFDAAGRRLGSSSHAIQVWRPAEDHVEQSSDDIWRAVCGATGAAVREAGIDPSSVVGIGFDATCSLVALDEGDRPVSVSVTNDDAQNVIVWMDHRATEQAARINGTRHEVLRYVGGVISPEMEAPKLLWLAENHATCWARTRRFLDLPDFLVYRATGEDVRSLCSTVCKWTYVGHEERWDDDFFRQIGLGQLVDEGHARIGTRVRPMGERAGALTDAAAREMGLAAGTAVGVSIIDAHAGGLGLLGGSADVGLGGRLALISGTSSCHMAVSREPRFVPGVWGPYFSAMVPGWWLAEGGQSATGALLDHVIHAHARGADLAQEARGRGVSVHALLNERLDALSAGHAFPASLAGDLHVLPDHHGNRSPRADPTLRGMVSGLKMTDSVDALAITYLATVQAIAHGTKHIVDTLDAHGFGIRTVLACGGDTKNPVFVREHADVLGLPIVLPEEPESVLLGAAILGAVAAGDAPGVEVAMARMSGSGRVVAPAGGEVAAFHERKHAVFLAMHGHQMEYRRLMGGAS